MLKTRQWEFLADMNYDGAITVSDVGLWAKWFMHYPGDYLISKMIGTDFGNFFEVSSSDYGGGFSIFIAIILTILFVIGLVID